MPDSQSPKLHRVAYSNNSRLSVLFNSPYLKIGLIILILISIIVAALLITLMNQPQILTIVGSKKLTTNDLAKNMNIYWGSYAEKVRKDPKLMQKEIQRLTDEEILKQEAQKIGITVSDKEIEEDLNKIIETIGRPKYEGMIAAGEVNENSEKEKSRIILLKKKVTEKVVGWKIVEGATAFRDPNSAAYKEEMEKLKQAFEQIREILTSGKTPAEAIAEVQKIKPTELSEIREVPPTRAIKAEDGWAGEFKNEIFATPKGNITQVTVSAGGAIFVGRVVSENEAQYDSYDHWFSEVKKQYIK